METFTFRPIDTSDISLAIGKASAQVTVTKYPDGSVEIKTPDLTAAQRTALKSLFVAAGLVEVL